MTTIKITDNECSQTIFEGFLSKNGTTYCITSKFTNKIKQYAELLEEK